MNKILVAIDGSEPSDRAMAFAVDLAKVSGAGLLVLNVVHETALVPVPMGVMAEVEGAYMTTRDAMQSSAIQLTERAITRAEVAGLTNVERLVQFGTPAKVIVEMAEDEDVDLIVMGRRGLGDFSGLILGSVTHKVGHLAHRPVATVP